MHKGIRLAAAAALALLCTAVLERPVYAESAPERTVTLHIDSQPLDQALNAFAQQAGLQLLMRADAAASALTAPRLVGTYTAQEALERLLADTELSYKFIDTRTVAIRAQKAKFEAPLSRSQQALSQREDSRLVQSEPTAKVDGEGTSGKSSSTDSTSTHDALDDIQEIIVTAQKRQQRLQEVPLSVTAFSSADLRQRGAVDIKDVLGSVPGLTFSGNSERGQSRFTIRGVDQIGGDLPTTGIYLDDIPLTTPQAFQGALDILFFDIERLEVLKGPQGTLYGGTAMGGAIKYVRARPDLSRASSNAAVGVATTHLGSLSYKAEGVVNIPVIADTLAVRFGLSALHEGGYIDNIANGDLESRVISSTPFPTYTPLLTPSGATRNWKDYNFANTYVANFSLLWQVAPGFTIRPAVLYQDFNQENPSWFFPNLPAFSASYRNLPQQTQDRVGLYSLDINKQFSGADLYSLTSLYDRTVLWERDYSYFFAFLFGGNYSLNGFAHYPSHATVFSQEFRLSSKADADARLHWLVGLYYSTQDAEFTPTAYLYNFGLPGDSAFSSSGPARLDQYAAFGEATYRIAGALDLTAGARLYWFDQTSRTAYSGPFSPNTTISLASKENGINPKIGLSYTLNTDHILYANAAKGFRPGAPIQNTFAFGCTDDLIAAGFDPAHPPDHYESDNLWTYDIGSKNEFSGRRFLLNGSAFLTDWKDIQQGILFPTCGQGTTVNAGAAKIIGAEIETRLEVTRALQVGGNAAYMHTEITDPGVFSALRKGDAIGDVPRWNASLYGVYTTPVNESWDLRFRGDYQYQTKSLRRGLILGVTYPNGPGLSPKPEQVRDGYDVFNASVSLSSDLTDIRLYVNNAFGAKPLLFGGGFDVSFGSTLNDTLRPRTIGLEVRRKL